MAIWEVNLLILAHTCFSLHCIRPYADKLWPKLVFERMEMLPTLMIGILLILPVDILTSHPGFVRHRAGRQMMLTFAEPDVSKTIGAVSKISTINRVGVQCLSMPIPPPPQPVLKISRNMRDRGWGALSPIILNTSILSLLPWELLVRIFAGILSCNWLP